MTNRHKFHDGRGEVRIYAALEGCHCSWCVNQRKVYEQQDGDSYLIDGRGHLADKAGNKIADDDGSAISVTEKSGPYTLDDEGYLVDRNGRKVLDKNGNTIRPVKIEEHSMNTNYYDDDEMTPEKAGDRLGEYAMDISRRENVPIHEANRLAVVRHPRLAAIYEQISTHPRQRNG